MLKPAVLIFQYRNNTGGDTGEITISPTFLGTSEEKGQQDACDGPLQYVSSPSSSLLATGRAWYLPPIQYTVLNFST